MITHGLNYLGGLVSSGLGEYSQAEETPAAVSLPITLTGDWYVRVRRGSEVIGPMDYRKACRHARYMSMRGTGLAEVITYLGQREGDPALVPLRTCVQSIYTRGKRFLSGRAAQFHSDRELLTEAPDYGLRL